MLGKFFERFKPHKFEDPYFGTLIFFKAARSHHSYWEGKRVFEWRDGNVEIEISIDAHSASDAPSKEQREFFEWVEANFNAVCLAVAQHLQTEPWTGRVTIKPFMDEFTVGHLSIPLCEQPNEEWEIGFDSGSDPEHLYTARLSGLAVTDISMDG